MVIIRNLNVISVQSWTYLGTPLPRMYCIFTLRTCNIEFFMVCTVNFQLFCSLAVDHCHLKVKNLSWKYRQLSKLEYRKNDQMQWNNLNCTIFNKSLKWFAVCLTNTAFSPFHLMKCSCWLLFCKSITKGPISYQLREYGLKQSDTTFQGSTETGHVWLTRVFSWLPN